MTIRKKEEENTRKYEGRAGKYDENSKQIQRKYDSNSKQAPSEQTRFSTKAKEHEGHTREYETKAGNYEEKQ